MTKAVVAAVKVAPVVTESVAAVVMPAETAEKPARRGRKPKVAAEDPAIVTSKSVAAPAADLVVDAGIEAPVAVTAPQVKPARRAAKAAAAASPPVIDAPVADAEPAAVDVDAAPAGPAKKGWWQRTFG